MTLTYVHTRGRDRDKWSPEGRKERIETGVITQTFIHILQRKKISEDPLSWAVQTHLQSLHCKSRMRKNTFTPSDTQ